MQKNTDWSPREKLVLVTGAAGFIGSHLVERLVKEGAKVRAFVHYNSAGRLHNLEFLPADTKRELEIISGDIQDPFQVRNAVKDCDTVFHLASLIAIPYSYISPASYADVNVKGTLNVLEACRTEGVRRLIHTSTSEVYGTALYTPIDEKHPLQGQSPYSATKIGADKLVESYHRSFDLPAATIRPFNTFGPRQSPRAIIPTILCQLLNKSGTLKLGATDPVRDFLFVSDTVQGFLAVAGCDDCVGKVTNVGTGRGITIEGLARLLMNVIGQEAEVICDQQRVRPSASEVRALICDATAAKERFGWSPSVTLEEGLKMVAAFVESNPELFMGREYRI